MEKQKHVIQNHVVLTVSLITRQLFIMISFHKVKQITVVIIFKFWND